MHTTAQLFADSLRDKNLNCDISTTDRGDSVIRFPYDGKITSFYFSGDNGEYVSMYTILQKAPEDKLGEAIFACNQLNAEYKWLKFYVDSDGDIMVQDDAIVDEENCADECFELLLRRINILKDAIPVIMRAIYA